MAATTLPPMLFPLGRTVITATAQAELVVEDACKAIARHVVGDWGDLEPSDREANDAAVLDMERILSAYSDRNGRKFWIITEADRSGTTVLLPEDY